MPGLIPGAAKYTIDPTTGQVSKHYQGADFSTPPTPAEIAEAYQEWGVPPGASADQAARTARRVNYQAYGADHGPNPVSEAQNTSDVQADNAEQAKRAQAVVQQQLAGQRAGNGGPGGYVDNAGVYHEQAPTLGGIAGGLSDSGSNISRGFDWGGTVNGAADATARAQGLAGAADKRAFIQGDYGMADQSRTSQQDALGLYRDAAYGKGPSAAQAQLQMGVDRGISGAMSIGNSARGGALGLAQGRLAAQNSAQNSIAQSAAQATSLRNQEMQQGMAGYAGLGSQIRGQDQQQATSQAQFGLASQAQNDARNQAYEQQGYNVTAAQMQGQQGRVNAQLGALGASQQGVAANAALQAQNQQHSEDNTWKYLSTIAGVGTGFGAAALSAWGGSAKGDKTQTGETNPGGTGATPGGGGTDVGLQPGAGDLGGGDNGGVSTASTPAGLRALRRPNAAPTPEPTARMSQWGRGAPTTTGWSPRKYF